MNRRRFLGYTAFGSATVLSGSAPFGCAPGEVPSDAPAGDEPFELHEATVADLQQGMESGRWTARSITEVYLARIEGLDRRGPELRSIIEINPEALSIADALDAERARAVPASAPRIPAIGTTSIPDQMTRRRLPSSRLRPGRDSFL
jgi:amidase